MSSLCSDAATLTQWPTAERVRALKRIIPRSKIQVILRRWYEDLLAEIAADVLPERRNRLNPRVIKRKMSNWRKKRPEHRHYPQPTKKFRQSVVMLN